MTSCKRLLLLVGLTALVLASGVQPLLANTITLTLSQPNTAVSPYPAPYGTVQIAQAGNTAVITFTSATTGGYTYLFGAHAAFAVNVNAASFTVTPGALSGPSSGGFDAPSLEGQGSGNVDGFGDFNLTFDLFDGAAHVANSFSFTVTNTSSKNWQNANQVLKLNGNNAEVAAHIFVFATPPVQASGAVATGYASNGGATVPDGGMTMTLLGLALAGLGLVARRMK